MRGSNDYRDLEVWKRGIELVKLVYGLTEKFPTSEKFGLSSQIRRAAVSIPSNIAEGQSRNGRKEFKQFLSIALGSIAEVETQTIIAKELGYTDEQQLKDILTTTDTLTRMTKGLIKSLGTSNQKLGTRNSILETRNSEPGT